MEIKVGSNWKEEVEMGEVVTVTGRYLNLDTNQISIAYDWFGTTTIQDLDEFKKEFRPIRESIPDKSEVMQEAVVLVPYAQYKDLLSKSSILTI